MDHGADICISCADTLELLGPLAMAPFEQPDPLETLKGVSRVALKKITAQSPKDVRDPMYRKPLETYVAQMLDAVLDRDQAALRTAVHVMQKAMITRAQIAEVYVPIVARRLGDAWVADELDFGAVTIGAARLQGLLHHLGSQWSEVQAAASKGAECFLVGVPDGVQHTLGAAVLSGQLRYRGFPTYVDLELTPEGLDQVLDEGTYAGILLSVSGKDHLESLKQLVEGCKYERRKTPVIIGGIILEQVSDILSLIPADFATCDVREALAFCGAPQSRIVSHHAKELR